MEACSHPTSCSPAIDPGYDEITPTSRILYHIPCSVCHDYSSGKHYGIHACDGCAGFFKRSIRQDRQYVCKANNPGRCVVDKSHRNQCRACRLRKCIDVGMNKDAVQQERGPRSSTLMRHFNLQHEVMNGDLGMHHNVTATLTTLPLAPFITNPFIMGVPISSMQHPASPAGFYANPAFLHTSPSFMTLPAVPPNVGHMSIHEIAAEHLFRNIYQMKHMGRFMELSVSDQLLLIEGCWKETFVLSLVQHMMPLQFDKLLQSYVAEKGFHHYTHQLAKDVELIDQTVNIIFSLHLDSHEFDYLRAIILFQKAYNESAMSSYPHKDHLIPAEKKLREGAKIEIMYEEACANLLSYLIRTRANEARYKDVLHLIPHLRAAPLYTIEELFFRKTIGNTTIMRLITDLYVTKKL